MTERVDDPTKHSLADDALGLSTGVVLAGVGTYWLAALGLVTGQTAGMAFLIAYATGWPFGAVFFAINLPFYGLAVSRLGWVFTLRTLLAVAGLSAFVTFAPDILPLAPRADPLAVALVASTLIGVGLLVLFRHSASLGGVGILALWIQDKTGFRAGWLQLIIDAGVFATALLVIAPLNVAISLAGALVLNVILALNHRRDRYIAR